MWFYLYLLTTSIHIRGGWTMLGKTINMMDELDHYKSSYHVYNHSWNMIAVYNVSMSIPIGPMWDWLSLKGDVSYHDNKGVHWSKLTELDVEKGFQLFYVNYKKINIDSLYPINKQENYTRTKQNNKIIINRKHTKIHDEL